MDKYRKSNEFQCNVTASPSERPVLNRRLSVYPIMHRKRTPAIVEFQGSNNEKELYDIGERLEDMSLICDYYHEDDAKYLELLASLNRETYVYSGVPGSLFQHCPLTRGVRGDPCNGTYTGTLVPKTVVYFPVGDTTSHIYLEETDFANNPILAMGKRCATCRYETSLDLPLGRGVAILSEAKNMVKNSLFDDSGVVIYNWTHSSGTPMDRLKTDGWMGVNSVYVWGIEAFTSAIFDISSLVDGDSMAVSFGWRTDGSIRVRFHFSNGAATADVDVVVSDGAGYKQTNVVIPAGMGGAGGACSIAVSLSSGQFGEICAPQAILGTTANGGRKEYYAFLGGLGDGIQGEITAQSLKYTGEWQAGMWGDALGSDSFICVSGYVQPLIGHVSQIESHGIFSLVNQNNKELECRLKFGGTHLRAYLRADGVGLTNVDIPNYTDGSVLFVALCVGWTAGVCHKRLLVRVVGDTTTYVAEHTGTAQFFSMYDTLWIGSDENEASQADCLFQDVNIWAGTEAMADTMVEYMTVLDNLRTVRDTLGRLYRVVPKLDPQPHNARRYEGEVYCINTKVL